ncbi:MAG: DUF4157 domain-containing protein, partial [Saccharothrix sp.]|nr:DUF4157 domain-containing protein [Saccharothrix sp.]
MRQHGQRAESAGRKAQGEEREEVAGRSPVTPAGPTTPEAALAMQRLMGNAAVVQRPARHEHADGCCGSGGTVQRDAVARSLGSPGRPLGDDIRSEMEGRIGHDFSDVRIHTDATAHAAAESVQAHAFTTGSDIVFQRSQYDPATVPGKKRLAHELLHVVQQRQGPVEGTDNGRGAKVSDPSDRFERAASA